MKGVKRMKRIFSVLFAAVVVLCMLSGCSMKNETYSDEEKQVVKAANQIISSEYDVTFDEGDFSYSVGKQIKENEFVSLDSEEKQQETFENIVSVSALKTSLHEKGEVYAYSVIFNSQTKEIVSISVNVE